MTSETKFYMWHIAYVLVETVFPENTRRGTLFDPLKDAVFAKFVEYSYLNRAEGFDGTG